MIIPRIVCVSANPGIDFRLRLRSFATGTISRAQSSETFPGGKAAHVALAAHALGAKAIWIGFLGGVTGQELAAQLRKLEIEIVGIRTSAATRVNLEFLEDSGRITEVLGPGTRPELTETRAITRALTGGLRKKWRRAVVVISGSLPLGVPPTFYRTLIANAASLGSQVFLDTSGDALRASLPKRPAFVKPNLEEVEAFLGHRLKNRTAIADAAHELVSHGALSVAISLGAEGLIWVERENGPVWFARPPRMNSISTVGCGDATTGGFAFASAKGLSGEAAIRLATSCGAANCLAKAPGRISFGDVRALMPRIKVQRIS